MAESTEPQGLMSPDDAPLVADNDTRRALDRALADVLDAHDVTIARDKAVIVRAALAALYPAPDLADDAPAVVDLAAIARGDGDALPAAGPAPVLAALADHLADRWPLADAASAGLSPTRPPAVPWLMRQWIPDAALTLLAGAGEVGKSTLAVQLTTALAAGRRDWLTGPPGVDRPALDIPAHVGAPAMLATYEDAADRVQFLAYRLAEADRPDEPRDAAADRWRENMDDRWHLADLSAQGPLYSVPMRAPERAGPTAAYDNLRRYAVQHGVRLVVVDSAASAYDGNENDRQAVRGFLATLAALARELPAAVILVQHPPKPSQPGANTHAYSGSTDWRNMPRAVLALEPAVLTDSERDAYPSGQHPTVRLRRDKGNYSPRPADTWLHFDPWPRFVATAAPDAAASEIGASANGAAGGYTAAELA